LFIAITVAFIAVCVAYVRWCDRIIGPDDFGTPEPDGAETDAAGAPSIEPDPASEGVPA
jgi:hypothetical protein